MGNERGNTCTLSLTPTTRGLLSPNCNTKEERDDCGEIDHNEDRSTIVLLSECLCQVGNR